MKVAIQNQKGGVGKTRTAMFLAAAARRAGNAAEVWDIDPQGSATSWADRAEANGTPLEFQVTPVNIAQLRRQAPEDDVLRILDTPPGNPAITAAAFRWADITVIPTGPDLGDVERAVETWEQGDGAKAGVLLTKYVKTERDSWDTRIQLRDSDVAAFDTIIPRRAAIASAFGTAIPKDLYHYEKLYAELLAAVTGEEQAHKEHA